MAKKLDVKNESEKEKRAKSINDYEYAVQLTRWLLLPLGLWPTKSVIYQRIVRPLAISVCTFIMMFVIVPLCLFIFLVVKDLGIRLKLIGPLGFGLMSLFKYVMAIVKSDEIASCFLGMSLDWQELRSIAERRIMLDNAKTGRVLTMICVLFMVGGGMPYITVLPLTKGPVVRGNVSLYPLAYPSYFVFFNPQLPNLYSKLWNDDSTDEYVDAAMITRSLRLIVTSARKVYTKNLISDFPLVGCTSLSLNCSFDVWIISLILLKPVYDYVFTVHCMCGLTRYSVTCGVYSIAILCIMHICSQISITTLMLEKLVDNFDSKLLGEIVNQHLRFLKFASKLESIFNEICLVEVLGSTCIICFLGYYLITEYENRETVATVTYFLLLISFVFNIFILCYIGEILTEQCQSIGTAAYMVDWYQLSGKDARNVILLVVSTQRPVFLTAGKMVNLSLLSFSNVIKASASYLNMLRTVTANSS